MASHTLQIFYQLCFLTSIKLLGTVLVVVEAYMIHKYRIVSFVLHGFSSLSLE